MKIYVVSSCYITRSNHSDVYISVDNNTNWFKRIGSNLIGLRIIKV